MGTFASEIIEGFDQRWGEVDLLINEAKNATNQNVHDALCRSAIVMIVAHFEGDLKELIRALIRDLNKFAKFQHGPKPTQRHFVRNLIGSDDRTASKQQNERELRLIAILSELDADIEVDPFCHSTANPTPAIITGLFEPLGTKNAFGDIAGSLFDKIFEEGDKMPMEKILFSDFTAGCPNPTTLPIPSISDVLKSLKSHLVGGLQTHPYVINPKVFSIDDEREQARRGAEGAREPLWGTFLDDLLAQRHSIAHGSSLQNSKSFEEVLRMRQKIEILFHLLAAVACKNFCLEVPPSMVSGTITSS